MPSAVPDQRLVYTFARAAVPYVRSRVVELNQQLATRGFDGRVRLTVLSDMVLAGPEVNPQVVVALDVSGAFGMEGFKFRGLYEFLDGVDAPLRRGFSNDFDHAEPVARHCDHCGRRQDRTRLFVYEETESGRLWTLGSTCVTDFAGHSPSSVLAGVAEAEGLFEDIIENLRRGTFTVEPLEYVAMAVLVTRIDGGYVPVANTDDRSPTRDTATRAVWSRRTLNELVWGRVIYEHTRVPQWVRAKRDRLLTEAKAEAEAMLTWARNLDGGTDFEANLRVVATARSLGRRQFGLAAYLPTAYRRAHEAREEAEAAASESRPAISEGAGLAITDAKVLSLRLRRSPYGPVIKMLIRLPDRNKLWGTLPAAGERDSTEPGDKVSLVANVQRSDDDPHFGFFRRPRKWRNLSAEARRHPDRLSDGTEKPSPKPIQLGAPTC